MKQINLICSLAVIFTFSAIGGFAQSTSISDNPGHTPHASSVLDIQSLDKGILTPRMLMSQRDAIIDPAEGLMIYQLDNESGYYFYNGSNWEKIGSRNNDVTNQLLEGAQDENAPTTQYVMDPINTTAIFDSSGIIYDSGGEFGNYFNNQESAVVLYPPGGFGNDSIISLGVRIKIEQLNTDLNDSLRIILYNGNDFHIEYFKGDISNIELPVSSDFATIYFYSDQSVTDAGFKIKFDWIFPPENNGENTNSTAGWFFEPSKIAMRGGSNFKTGWSYDSLGLNSFSYGKNTTASGINSMAIGEDAVATKNGAVAIGYRSEAIGDRSLALMGGEANAPFSLAFGQFSHAQNTGSIAIGDAYAQGYQSVSLGGGATGSNSFSSGQYTKAEGINSVAFGRFSQAIGDRSFAAGNDCDAVGYNSVAIGNELFSKSGFQTVFGTYNVNVGVIDPDGFHPSDQLFVVGNGTEIARSNALTVMKDARMGIGTHIPSYMLHVKSKLNNMNVAYFQSDSTNSVAIGMKAKTLGAFQIIYNGLTDKASFSRFGSLLDLDFGLDQVSVNGKLVVNDSIQANNNNGLVVSSYNENVRMELDNSTLNFFTNNAERISIAQLGNVGIGTSNPTAKLDVNGSLQINETLKSNTDGGLAFLTNDNLERLTITDSGNIGIGITNPTSKLHVEGILEVDNEIRADDADGLNFSSDDGIVRLKLNDNGRIGIGSTNPSAQFDLNSPSGTDAMRIRTFEGTRLRVFNNGKVRIGINSGAGTAQLNINSLTGVDPLIVQENSSTHFMVHDNGGVSIGSSSTPGSQGIYVTGSDAAKSGGGSWTATSDIRLKKVHKEYSDGLDELLKIRPIIYSYNEKSGYATDEQHIGVVAQELKEIAPYMVDSIKMEGEDYLTVDNSAMMYMLINAVKEQQKMIDTQQKMIDGLNRKIDRNEKVKVK